MEEKNYRARFKFPDIEVEVEGDREFVDKHLTTLLELLKQPKLTEGLVEEKVEKKAPPKPRKPRGRRAKAELVLEKTPEISIEEFFEQKKPKTHNEAVLVISYWLTKYAGKKEIRPKDIRLVFEQLKTRKPGNVGQHIRILSDPKKGFLKRGQKTGRYFLTPKGIELVEKLPKR